MVEGQENLKEIVPYCVFRQWTTVSAAVLDDTSEVAAATILQT